MTFLIITFDDIKAGATFFAAVIAAVASIYVAYRSRKSAHKLEEQKNLLQSNIELLKNQLERDKNFSAFKRDRIFKHLDNILLSFSQIHSLIKTMGLRLWIKSNLDLESETKFRDFFSSLNLNFYSLYNFKVLPKESLDNFEKLSDDLFNNWDLTMAEAACRTKEFMDDFPDDKKYNRKDFHEAWIKLGSSAFRMARFIGSLNSIVEIPE